MRLGFFTETDVGYDWLAVSSFPADLSAEQAGAHIFRGA